MRFRMERNFRRLRPVSEVILLVVISWWFERIRLHFDIRMVSDRRKILRRIQRSERDRLRPTFWRWVLDYGVKGRSEFIDRIFRLSRTFRQASRRLKRRRRRKRRIIRLRIEQRIGLVVSDVRVNDRLVIVIRHGGFVRVRCFVNGVQVVVVQRSVWQRRILETRTNKSVHRCQSISHPTIYITATSIFFQ